MGETLNVDAPAEFGPTEILVQREHDLFEGFVVQRVVLTTLFGLFAGHGLLPIGQGAG